MKIKEGFSEKNQMGDVQPKFVPPMKGRVEDDKITKMSLCKNQQGVIASSIRASISRNRTSWDD